MASAHHQQSSVDGCQCHHQQRVVTGTYYSQMAGPLCNVPLRRGRPRRRRSSCRRPPHAISKAAWMGASATVSNVVTGAYYIQMAGPLCNAPPRRAQRRPRRRRLRGARPLHSRLQRCFCLQKAASGWHHQRRRHRDDEQMAGPATSAPDMQMHLHFQNLLYTSINCLKWF
jgi:hypothetical protein